MAKPGQFHAKCNYLQNRNVFTKNKFGNSNFDLCRTFSVNKHYFIMKDASDASRFKVPIIKWFLSLMLHPSTEK